MLVCNIDILSHLWKHTPQRSAQTRSPQTLLTSPRSRPSSPSSPSLQHLYPPPSLCRIYPRPSISPSYPIPRRSSTGRKQRQKGRRAHQLYSPSTSPTATTRPLALNTHDVPVDSICKSLRQDAAEDLANAPAQHAFFTERRADNGRKRVRPEDSTHNSAVSTASWYVPPPRCPVLSLTTLSNYYFKPSRKHHTHANLRRRRAIHLQHKQRQISPSHKRTSLTAVRVSGYSELVKTSASPRSSLDTEEFGKLQEQRTMTTRLTRSM